MRHYLNSAPKGHPQYVARPVALGHGSAAMLFRKNGAVTIHNDRPDSRELAVIGAYSDAFERAAAMFGVGQFLCGCDPPWVAVDERRQVLASEMPKLHAVQNGRQESASELPAILRHDMARHAGHRR